MVWYSNHYLAVISFSVFDVLFALMGLCFTFLFDLDMVGYSNVDWVCLLWCSNHPLCVFGIILLRCPFPFC